MAPEEAVSNDVTQWLSCIVGNVGARFWKQSTGRTLQSYDTAGIIIDNLMTKIHWVEPEISPFLLHTFFLFLKPGAYITYNASHHLKLTGSLEALY